MHKTIVDFIVVGQGLAGSVLAMALLERGQDILVLDHASEHGASDVAAGLFNPLTGKRWRLTPQASACVARAREFYAGLEKKMATRFFFPMEVLRVFQDEQDRQRCLGRFDNDSYRAYLGKLTQPGTHPWLHMPWGGIRLLQGGYLNVRSLLYHCRRHFTSLGIYRDQQLQHNLVQIHPDRIQLGELAAKQLIFCEGSAVTNNPWFTALGWKPAKGEILTLKTTRLPDFHYIIHRGNWLLPLGNGVYRLGANYQWPPFDQHPDERIREQLLAFLPTALKYQPSWQVLAHHAGVRPCSRDAMPVMGRHRSYSRLSCFNGFGSKGSVLIPRHAAMFCDYLLNGTPLNPSVDLARFRAAPCA